MNNKNLINTKTIFLIFLVFISLFFIIGCKEKKSPIEQEYTYKALEGPYSVIKNFEVLIDVSRNRNIGIKIFSQSELTDKAPLVLITHGFGETYESYDYLAEHLASYGYIVISINHEDSDKATLDKEGLKSLTNPELFETRPQDVQFVLDQVLSNKIDNNLLKNKVDVDKIGIAGHSLGSTTSLQMIGLTVDTLNEKSESFKNSKIKASIAMSPQLGNVGDPEGDKKYGIKENSWDSVVEPVMLMWGTKDIGFGLLRDNPNLRDIAYESIPGKNIFKAIIKDAEHHAFTETKPWYPGGKRDSRHHGWIQQSVVAFFDAYLLDNDNALLWLENKELQKLTNDIVIQEDKRLTLIDTNDLNFNSIELFILKDKDRNKDLQLRITYPEEEGTYPVIIFSHFSGGTKDYMLPLIETWAKNGYIVIQPDHSDSPNVGGKRGVYDVEERALDISFIIDSLNEIKNELQINLNNKNIGVVGHYLGANTANLVSGADFSLLGTPYKDDRVDAVMLMSPTGTGQGFDENSWDDVTTPMMVITGSKDPSSRTGNPPEWRTEPFIYSPSDGRKHLIFITSLDSKYGGLTFNKITNKDIIDYIETATINYWNAYLKNDGAAEKFLTSDILEDLSDNNVEVSWK